MASDLKPCPFCGRELNCTKELWRIKETKYAKHVDVYTHPHVGCILDDHRFHFYIDPQREMEKWNRRADDGKKD